MNRPHKLKTGVNATLKPWPTGEVGTGFGNFMALLQAMQRLNSDPADTINQAQVDALIPAVLENAGLNPEKVSATDLTGILQAVRELNGVDDLVGKPLALLVELFAVLTAASGAAEDMAEESGTSPS